MESKKKVAILSKDKSTIKLIDCILSGDDFDKVEISAVEELNKRPGNTEPPGIIIFDHSASQKPDELPCQPLREYNQFDLTPRVIFSTYRIDCTTCPSYQADKCAHYQKPFKIHDVSETVWKLAVIHSGSKS